MASAEPIAVQIGPLFGISEWYESGGGNNVLLVVMSPHLRDVYIMGLHIWRCWSCFPTGVMGLDGLDLSSHFPIFYLFIYLFIFETKSHSVA